MTEPDESTCRSCGAPILWALTEKGRRMPLDYQAERGALDGKFVLLEDVAVSTHSERADVKAAINANAKLYASHFATCPNAGKHRKGKR